LNLGFDEKGHFDTEEQGLWVPFATNLPQF